MKKTLTKSEIARELYEDKYANWSWGGSLAMAAHLEELEHDSGEEMELHVVAIRGDFSEYASLADWAEEYFGGEEKAIEALGLSKGESLEDAEDEIREHIQDRGTLIEFDCGIIVSSF